MNKCDIAITMAVGENDGNVGLSVKVNAEGLNMFDRFVILHSLAQSLDLDKTDISIYAMAEIHDLFNDIGKEVRIDLNALRGLGYEG